MFRFNLTALLLTFCLNTISYAESPNEFRVAAPTTAALLQTLDDVRSIREQQSETVTIIIPAGRYEFSEPLTLDAQLVGLGLKLVAAESGKVIFAGSQQLSISKREDNGRLHFQLPDGWNKNGQPRAMIVNGKLSSPARFPNQGYLRIEKAVEDRRSGFIVQAGDLSQKTKLPASGYDLILMHDWSSSRLPVASFDAESRTLKTVGPIGCSAAHYAIDHFEKQPRYYLEGHASFADLPGEWFIDAKNSELIILPAAYQAEPAIALPILTTLFSAIGTDDSPITNLSVQGIIFSETAFPMPAGGMAGAQASMHEPRDATGKRITSDRPMLPAGVYIENAKGCRFQGCQFQAMGGTGLWFSSRTNNCLMQRCTVTDVGGNGLNLGENNSRRVDGKAWYQSAPEQVPTANKIDQCEVSQCGMILPGSVAIWAPLNFELEITNNHIHDCPYTGISLGWIWNPSNSPAGKNRIADNRIQYMMQVLSDGGGIYTLGHQPESVIEGNLITDIPLNAGRAESNGMFLDEGSTGFTIRNHEIRRIDRSPIRFHKAGENVVENNRWELATESTPPVRFNNTPEKNIKIVDNKVLEPQKRIFLIGNSLTWDTIPSRLDEGVEWHVDCGKSLKYIQENSEQPCVNSSRLWPLAFRSTQYDLISFQPHYGTTLEEDFAVISYWLELQPKATIILHTGWARHAELKAEFADKDPAGTLTHSQAYFEALLKQLRDAYPDREFRSTQAMNALQQIQQDIETGKAPLENIEQMYRDSIHMTIGPGRYLMHNMMRKAMGQKSISDGFPEFDAELKTYLDGVMQQF